MKKKAPLTEEQKSRRRASRAIGFAIFGEQFNAENPDAGRDARKAAWKSSAKQYTKIGMKVLKRLEKAGFALSAPVGKQAAE
ncbi:MAG: hypothetical protein RIG84_08380 [Roseovarius sp.]